MKSISASIVVLAGIYGLVAAAPHIHQVTGFILTLAGVITLALGLVGWWASLKYDR